MINKVFKKYYVIDKNTKYLKFTEKSDNILEFAIDENQEINNKINIDYWVWYDEEFLCIYPSYHILKLCLPTNFRGNIYRIKIKGGLTTFL